MEELTDTQKLAELQKIWDEVKLLFEKDGTEYRHAFYNSVLSNITMNVEQLSSK